MFLHLSLILSTGGAASGGVASRGGLHPGEVCIQGSLHPGGGGQNPPSDPIEYGQRAGATHPNGMHSCTNFYLLN